MLSSAVSVLTTASVRLRLATEQLLGVDVERARELAHGGRVDVGVAAFEADNSGVRDAGQLGQVALGEPLADAQVAKVGECGHCSHGSGYYLSGRVTIR